ncbi:hypothetical protein APHAL10511_003895 [Amanita phalloides]|nr:hypothetical protein APHAL10511_003895 [Amanita phalloides]
MSSSPPIDAVVKPCAFNNLPPEILSRIFILCTLYPIELPYVTDDLPDQLVLSQVCLKWRQIALDCAELWNNVMILQFDADYDHCASLYRTWVARAKDFPLTVKMELVTNDLDVCKIFRDFVLSFRIKMLAVTLSYETLSQLQDVPSLDIEEFSVGLTDFPADTEFIVPLFMGQVQRLCFRCLGATTHQQILGLPNTLLDNLRLPWHHLRIFECHPPAVPLAKWISILRLIPSLEKCYISIFRMGSGKLEGVSMPNLHWFILELHSLHPNIVVPLFTVPQITTLGIYSSGGWSMKTYDMVKMQYNLQQLERIELHLGYCPLSIAQILRDAPMIYHLHVWGNVILDADAHEKIASGQLGRFLTELRLARSHNGDGATWLGMVEARQKNICLMVDRVSNWKQEFTGLKWVEFRDVDRNIWYHSHTN